MKKTVSIVLSIGIAVLFVTVAVLFVWPYLPHSVHTPLPPTDTNEDDTTNPTHIKQNELYLSTSPSEWFSVGEDVNWNDQLIFRVENVRVSETLPEDVDEMTEWYIYGFDHYQQLVDNDPNKVFIDMTIQVTCIGLPSGSAYGMVIDEPYCSIATGQAVIAYYDEATGQLTESTGDGVGVGVATQDLSENADRSVGVDYYQLSVGETARFRVLHIISKEMWDEKAVLLTPQCGRYNTDQMTWMQYDQPHILLNKTTDTSSEWYGVSEEADWNGEFSVCVESAVTSKALPQGIESEDIWSSDIVRAADGTLTSPHIYVDVSVSITRLAETELELHGTRMPLCESVCVGNMLLAIGDSQTSAIADTEECRTFRNLSAELDMDHHGSIDLNVGETMRLRLVYVMREDPWNRTDVLFYPFAYIFDTYKMEHFGLDNVYILLNGKDVQE